MRAHLLAILLLSSLACVGCAGEAGSENDPPGPGTGLPKTDDPLEPCTDLTTCCTSADMECVNDPDNKPLCKCYKLWDCSQNPNKCQQDLPTPQGGSNWKCTWTAQKYSCSGTASSMPGGSGWACTNQGGTAWVCTRPTPPNPTNGPQGLSDWSCTVVAEMGKLVCSKAEPPPPPAKADAGVAPKADLKPPVPTVETNCADGVDNDKDGKVDCKDPDCPPCPVTPPPPGQEVCDGKDNNGDGRIDEGGVCNGVAEPCPPGAIQACDCYCGVHRRCKADGTWGPCKVDGNGTCAIAQITSHSQCGPFQFCDYGKCVGGIAFGCKHHSDCAPGLICDLGLCIPDPYFPCP